MQTPNFPKTKSKMLVNLQRISFILVFLFLIEKCSGMGNELNKLTKKMDSLLSKEKKEKAGKGAGSGSGGQSEMPMSLLEREEGSNPDTEKRKGKLVPSLLGSDEQRGKGKLVPSLLGTADERGKSKLTPSDEMGEGKFTSSLSEITALDVNMDPSQSESMGTVAGKEAELVPSLLDKPKKKGMASSLIGMVKKKGMAKSLLGTKEKKGMAPSLLEIEEKKGMAPSLLDIEEEKGMASSLLDIEEEKGMAPSLLDIEEEKGMASSLFDTEEKNVVAQSLLETGEKRGMAPSLLEIEEKKGMAPSLFDTVEKKGMAKSLLRPSEGTIGIDKRGKGKFGKLASSLLEANPHEKPSGSHQSEIIQEHISKISGKNGGLKILFVAPNIFRSHFVLNKIQIQILLQQEWVEKIHLFIPEQTSEDRKEEDLVTGGKLVVQYFNPHESKGNQPIRRYFANTEWEKRTLDNAMLSYPNTNEEIFNELFNEPRLIKALQEEHFDLGIAEFWDFMAFPLFWLVGIQNFAATSNMPLESNYYRYLGFLPEHDAISAASNKRGLVIISFGSIINTKFMPDKIFKKFVEMFKKFRKYEFIWKFDDSEVKRYHKLQQIRNVHTKMWIKQAALLASGETKLFISHCGINSILEAVQFAVPLLCIPFMADQFYNSEALAKRGIAVVVNKENMAEFGEKMEQALQPMYKQKMLDLKRQLQEARPAEIYLQKLMEFL